MAFVEKASLALFVNSKKQMEKQPDYTGSIEFPAEVLAQLKPGVKYDIAAWQKRSPKGVEYIFGLVGEEKDAWRRKQQQDQGQRVPVQAGGVADMKDDIPF